MPDYQTGGCMNTWQINGLQSGGFWVVVFGLTPLWMLLAAFYNWLYVRVSRRFDIAGFTWVSVAIGDALVILSVAFVFYLHPDAANWLTFTIVSFVNFTAWGIPMALGDMWRLIKSQRTHIEYKLKE